MERSSFIRNLIAIPAAAAGLNDFSAVSKTGSGIQKLSADRSFLKWTPDMPPAYRVQTGEIVQIELSHGMPGLVTRDGIFKEAGPEDRINPQTGPIYVEGISAGDCLAIDILDIQTDDWGYCSGRIFEISEGFVKFSDDLNLPVSPMLGCIGISPATGSADTHTPCDTGGNMDCSEIRAGSTIVFTAGVAGALAGMGDPHALQGDGEITGQGIETNANALIRFRRLPEIFSDRPVIIRNDIVCTMGADKNLEDAAWQATDDMVKLITKRTKRSEKEARLLVGLVGKLKINQIVDPAKGARMEVPAWIFGIK
jgi:amidase